MSEQLPSKEQLKRLRTLAGSSILGADLKWLLDEYDQLEEWNKQARMTFDRLAAFLQAKDVPYKVDWQDWIEEADRVLLARAAHETNAGPTPHHVRWDFIGWLCSVCGGWNDGTSRSCRWPHEHAQKANDEPTTCLGLMTTGVCSCGHHRGPENGDVGS